MVDRLLPDVIAAGSEACSLKPTETVPTARTTKPVIISFFMMNTYNKTRKYISDCPSVMARQWNCEMIRIED